MRRAFAVVVAVAIALSTARAAAQRPDPVTLDYRLQARALAPGVWVVEGDNAEPGPANGCNIINTGFIATGAGVLVINTGPSLRYGRQLRSLIGRTTAEPVVQVLHLNAQPDNVLGNQAFADVPRLATAGTRAAIARESAAYGAHLFRVCGHWMKDTETLGPDSTIDPAADSGRWRLGEREFEWREWRGPTGSDLVLLDRSSGVLFAGALVSADRVPTTLQARLAEWLDSLQQLQAFQGLTAGTVVPSHGTVHHDGRGLVQTRRYLQWLDRQLPLWSRQGLGLAEVQRVPLPPEFRRLAEATTEHLHNLAMLYPSYESQSLPPAPPAHR